jgi:ketosteroid isomerase-like protein
VTSEAVEAPLEVAEKFMSRLAGDLLGAIDDYGADDLTWQFPPSLIGGVVWSGKARILKRMAPVLANFQPGTMRIVQRKATVHSGNDVVCEFDLEGVTAAGAKYENTYVFFFEVVDGKIAGVREYMDTTIVSKVMSS